MKLYDAEWAPSPRRVRVYLAEKGITVPMVRLNLRKGEHLGNEYLAVNDRATVPALVLDDGSVLEESAAICRYFEALHPDPPLFGTSPEEIGRIESRIRQVEAEGYAAVVYCFRNSAPWFEDRAESGNWPPLPQIPQLAERGRIMWDSFLQRLDANLQDREWIAGDRFSYADITAMVAVDFGISVRLPAPEGRENVLRWHKAVSARPSAQA